MPRVKCILQIAFKTNIYYEDKGSREELCMVNIFFWRSPKAVGDASK
jgi:hypothetical protein